ncbi:MAG: tryptophan synthase subunit alpha [Nitrospinota bacterium]|nr:tryptophan synthase subunit alpha [Nitrospinota bacterium]
MSQLKNNKRSGLFPFITAGDPDLEFTKSLIRSLAASGADGFEIGVPFSDPLADGPTIQRASMRALEDGTNLKSVIKMIAEVREEFKDLPLVIMTYYNPIIAMGVDTFVQESSLAGIDAVIVPDLPPEESVELLKSMEEYPIELVFMLAPTSTDQRISLVNEFGGGFIYYVAQMGVTGARESLDKDLSLSLEKINKEKKLPVLVGFGIKTPEQAAEVSQFAEGIIVGSALIDVIEQNSDREDKLDAAAKYISSLKSAMDNSCSEKK